MTGWNKVAAAVTVAVIVGEAARYQMTKYAARLDSYDPDDPCARTTQPRRRGRHQAGPAGTPRRGPGRPPRGGHQ